MKRFVLSTLFLLSFGRNIFSYFETIDVWRHPITSQLVYGVADENFPSDESCVMRLDRECSNKTHAVIDSCALSDIAKEYSVVVEDLAGYHGSHEGVKEYQRFLLEQNPSASRSPLIGLAAYAEKKGLSVSNVEYRFVRSAGLYYKPYFPIYVRDLAVEYKEAFKEVKQFFGDNLLQQYYQEVVKSIEKNIENFFALMNTNNKEKDSEESALTLRGLTLFDSKLVSTRALNSIVNNPLKKKILMFLGARNMANIKPVLENVLGYECVKHVGGHYRYPSEPLDEKFFADSENQERHDPLAFDDLDILMKSLEELQVPSD